MIIIKVLKKKLLNDSKETKTEFPFWSDDIKQAKKEDEKRYKKQLRDSEKTLKTGKIKENKSEEYSIMNRLELIESILEISKITGLENVNKYVSQNGHEMNVNVLSRLNRMIIMRGVEHLMREGSSFQIAFKIVTEDV